MVGTAVVTVWVDVCVVIGAAVVVVEVEVAVVTDALYSNFIVVFIP